MMLSCAMIDDIARRFSGVEMAIDPMGREVYKACIRDSAGVDHQFSFNFATECGAAAAADLTARRLRSTCGEDATNAPANYGEMGWVELVAIMLAGAREARFDDDEALAVSGKNCDGHPKKRKRRSSREPHRHISGRRIYDSVDGVTCHWCRQKTVETHVVCTSEGCGDGRAGFKKNGRRALPSSFCGKCLRNRHGEDVDAAVASAGRQAQKKRQTANTTNQTATVYFSPWGFIFYFYFLIKM